MVNLIVEHKWNERRKDEVFKVVESIIGMEKGNKLPEGFKLNSVVVFPDNRAICNWDAPSKESLGSLVKEVNPPTDHEVYEVQKVF